MFAASKTAGSTGYGPSDPYFYDVSLLLNGDGTNGAQNNTFLDSSTNNFTITRNGNTTQGSFSPYGNLWSNYQPNAASDYVSFPSSSNFQFTGDFTIECWVYFSDLTGGDNSAYVNDGGGTYFALNISPTAGIYNIYLNSGSPTFSPSSGIVAGQWTHVALVRSGSTVTIYTNGVSKGTATNSSTLGFSSSVGNRNGGGPGGARWMSNLRIVKGTAVYTTTFTPPTTPLTAISGTSLLTCQSNRFIDNSSNNYTLTVSGSPSVQRFSPFNPTVPYDTATIGGSGYFDGSSYLTTPSSSQPVASGDFTISAWFYLTSFSNSYYVVGGNWTSGLPGEWLIQIQNNGAIRFLTNGSTSFSSSGLVSLNQWYYFSATRSGTTVTASLNGTSFASYTLVGALGLISESIYIGEQAGGSWPFAGYISDFRFVTSNLGSTVPTIPATAVSGTQLLTNFTNAGIPDLAMQNDLQTVGSAQVSTSTVKYGTGSLYFDGSTGYLTAPNKPVYQLGSGDFTIECWINFNSLSTNRGILYFATAYDSAFSYGLQWASNNLYFWYSTSGGAASYLSAPWTPSTGTWYHLAVTRNGSNLKFFINGTQIGTTQSLSGITLYATSANLIVGGELGGSGGSLPGKMSGYIDDFRITNGYARYVSNFTPPTSALPTY